jgi:hypothetical protein
MASEAAKFSPALHVPKHGKEVRPARRQNLASVRRKRDGLNRRLATLMTQLDDQSLWSPIVIRGCSN